MSDLVTDIEAYLARYLPASSILENVSCNVFCSWCLRSAETICFLCTKPYFHSYQFCRCYGPTGYRHGSSDDIYAKYAYVCTIKSFALQPCYCPICQIYLFPLCSFCFCDVWTYSVQGSVIFCTCHLL